MLSHSCGHGQHSKNTSISEVGVKVHSIDKISLGRKAQNFIVYSKGKIAKFIPISFAWLVAETEAIKAGKIVTLNVSFPLVG